MNKLLISQLNPIKFVPEGYTPPAIYNSRDHDAFRYQDTVPDFFAQRNFVQPWQSNDIIYLQFLCNYGPINVHVLSCDGHQVDSFAADYKPSSIEGTGMKAYEVAIALNTYPLGNYYLKLEAGSPILDTQVSEVFSITDAWPYSLLLEYSHDENDYSVAFETGIQFRFRIPGALRGFQPGADRTVFVDQVRNLKQLSGKFFATRELIIGLYDGVPDWMAERVCHIFNCSKVLVDGKQYVANEGASLEAVREEYFPMAGWKLEVRAAHASTAMVSDQDGNPNSELTVAYLIDTTGFGSKSQPSGSNVIQIEKSNNN